MISEYIYAKSYRNIFDMPIGINQYVQEHCAYLLSDVDGTRWATYLAAWKLSEGMPAEMEISIAKAFASDGHERVCWYAHQVFAGVGYTVLDGVVPLFSRRGKVLQLYLGDTTFHKEIIAEQLETWETPEAPKGAPLGLWGNVSEIVIPEWYDEFAAKAQPSS